jgi:hypothetical protein
MHKARINAKASVGACKKSVYECPDERPTTSRHQLGPRARVPRQKGATLTLFRAHQESRTPSWPRLLEPRLLASADTYARARDPYLLGTRSCMKHVEEEGKRVLASRRPDARDGLLWKFHWTEGRTAFQRRVYYPLILNSSFLSGECAFRIR